MKSACVIAFSQMLIASAALVAASNCFAQTPAEQAADRPLVVVMDDTYPPYAFRDAEGNLKGIVPDQWRLWEMKTGMSVELVATNWAAAQAIMKAGEADVIDTIFKTQNRMRLYDFSPPYAALDVPVFAHKDLSGIINAESLEGFKVGVKAGDAVIEHLTAKGISQLLKYDGYESLILAAKRGDIKVFSVDAPPAFYFMTRHGIERDYNKMFVLYTGNFHRAVAKGDTKTMQIVKRGFERITPREYDKIDRKWLGAPFTLAPFFYKWRCPLIAFAIGVLLLMAGNAFLGQLVKARTAKLTEVIARYNALAQQNEIISWEVDCNGLYTYISPLVTSTVGYPPEDLVGKNHFYDHHPDAGRSSFKKKLLRSMEDEVGLRDVIHPMIAANGDTLWFQSFSIPLHHPNGAPRGAWGTSTNITKRKRAEVERERLLLTLEQTTDAILITDAEGTIRYVNPAFEQLNGYAGHEVVGQKTRFLKSERHEPAFYKEIADTLLRGKAWEGRLEEKRKDGTFYTGMTSIGPARDPNGSLIGYIAVTHNITREIEAEKEKSALQNQLAQAQRLESIGLLAGGVAHDFNNMLQAILGYAEMALAATKEDETALRNDIAEIRKIALRPTFLTRQLLTFARRQPVEPQPIAPGRNVENMTGILKHLLGDSIRLKIVSSENVGMITIDPGQFEQIIINVCINARDAIEGAGEVRIATEGIVIDDNNTTQFNGINPGAYVRLSIADTGCGIPEESQSRIFEPFFSTKPAGQATGLGLPVVYGIVTQAGGTIRLHSTPGTGTEFNIYLPQTDKTVASAPEIPEAQAIVPSPSARILLVDDEALILKPTHTLITNLGHSAISANSPLEAIRAFEEHNAEIDLLISDVTMPDMSGPKLLQKLREIKPTLKCIFMSGHSAEHLRQGDLQGLNANFIQKPFTKAELADAIASMMEA
ncbi:MAG: PAS domain S-box protein [Kiritimatiellia bacterium]|jgi:PAS domain S-box-containing protein